MRDAVDHHATITVEAILTEGTIDAAARVDLDVRGAEQQLDNWVMFDNFLAAPGLQQNKGHFLHFVT
jgi:hypothetical protein